MPQNRRTCVIFDMTMEVRNVNGHQRQKEQSARMIEDALLALMGEKEFGKITVSELVKRADVARRTFYRLYAEKEDVLRGYLGRLCKDYQEAFPVLGNYNLKQIAGEFFGFWYKYREQLCLFHKCGVEEMIYHEISLASTKVVKERMGNSSGNEEEKEYFACYSAGGFLMLLRRWVEEGMTEPPEVYAKKVGGAILKFLSPKIIDKED